MTKLLVVSEQCWPEGTGGILTSHMIARILRDAGLELTIVHGAKRHEELDVGAAVGTYALLVANKEKVCGCNGT